MSYLALLQANKLDFGIISDHTCIHFIDTPHLLKQNNGIYGMFAK